MSKNTIPTPPSEGGKSSEKTPEIIQNDQPNCNPMESHVSDKTPTANSGATRQFVELPPLPDLIKDLKARMRASAKKNGITPEWYAYHMLSGCQKEIETGDRGIETTMTVSGHGASSNQN